MTTAITPPVPRRPRRWRRGLLMVLLLALVALGVPVGYWYYLSAAEDRAVAEAQAEAERLDPRWRLKQVLADRPAVPDAENGSLQVLQVMRVYGKRSIALPDPQFDDARKTAPVAATDPRDMAVLRQFLGTCPAALAEARKLRAMPRGRPPIGYQPDFIGTIIEPVQNAREVCALLNCDVLLRADERDVDGALDSCLAMLNAGRSIGEEPFAIAALVRFACDRLTIRAVERVLAHGEPGEAALAELQAALEAELAAPVLLTALRGERAGQDQLMGMIRDGKLKASYIAALIGRRTNWFDRYIQDFAPSQATAGRAVALRVMNAQVEAARLPIEQQATEFDRIPREWPDEPVPPPPLLPVVWFKTAIKAHLQTQSGLRCAVASLAAERYRHKHGQWPASLATLVTAGLLRDVPVDPFDGQPLRYQRLADGLAIYSIGPDGIDNGGAIDRTDDAAPGTDVGFRLWDVAARRQ